MKQEDEGELLEYLKTRLKIIRKNHLKKTQKKLAEDLNAFYKAESLFYQTNLYHLETPNMPILAKKLILYINYLYTLGYNPCWILIEDNKYENIFLLKENKEHQMDIRTMLSKLDDIVKSSQKIVAKVEEVSIPYGGLETKPDTKKK